MGACPPTPPASSTTPRRCSGSCDRPRVFETSTRTLLDAAGGAGVGHYVALSVVGTDRLAESGYPRAKIAQEKLITGSALPYSIVHATQFFEFASTIVSFSTDSEGTVRVAPVLIQPIAADDVATAVGRVAVGPPVNGIVEIAGPEELRMEDLVRRRLQADSDPRPVVTDPRVGYYGSPVDERTLLPGDGAQLDSTRFADWLGNA